MKIINLSLVLMCLSCGLLSCKQNQSGNKTVVIHGKIDDYSKNTSQKTIAFNFQAMVNTKTDIKVVSINSLGEFEVETHFEWPQDVFFDYGEKRFYLIGKPGASIDLSISNDIWDKADEEKIQCLSIIGGSAKEDNRHVNSFIQEADELLMSCTSMPIVKDYNPGEYKKYVLNQQKIALSNAYALLDSVSATPFFQKWAEDYINYYSYVSLLRYHFFHPAYNGIDWHDFKLPDDYYDFISQIDMNDIEVISTHHEEFYNQYGLYVDELMPRDSLEKDLELYNTNITLFFDHKVKQRDKYSSGFASDVLRYDIYSLMLDWSLVEEFKAIYQPDVFENKFFTNKIEIKLSKIEGNYNNPEYVDDLYFMDNNSIVTSLLDTINDKFKDKVIYIDFWSPGCGPCLKEMPPLKDLQREYQDKDVVFLFLSTGCNEKSWKSKISEKQLSGVHMLLNKDQFQVLSQKFEIGAIPHYVLIGKDGKIVSGNAPWPSDGELKNIIEGLL